MGELRTPKGAILDCDGTLLDSMGAWRELESMLASAAGTELSPDHTDVLSKLTIPEEAAFFHKTFGLGRNPDAVVGMIDDFMTAYYHERALERPGAVAFVERLVAAGVRCAVVSSSPQRYLRAGLAKIGLEGMVRAVLSVDDVGMSKRDPRIYLTALGTMDVSAGDGWGIDDSIYAIRSMNTAGLFTIGLHDRDDSGTFEELQGEANIAARSFEELEKTVPLFACC